MNAPEGSSSDGQRVLVLYWSRTGNTEKVARAVERGAGQAGVTPVVMQVGQDGELDLHQYDLVFLGAPSYSFLPPEPVLRFVKDRMDFHRKRGDIKLQAPTIPGKRAVVFVTYSGPHTGIDEAVPVGKYLGQFLAHLGFQVVDEWYVVGEFHGNLDNSTHGRLGDIRGRPTADELARIEHQAAAAVRQGTP